MKPMGFFGKIKQNLKHGGVTIDILPPERIEKGQFNVHVPVTLASSDNMQIKSVSARVERRYLNTGNNQRQPTVLGSSSYDTPFAINAGQPLSLQFDVSIAPADQAGDDHPALRSVVGALEKASNAYDKSSQRYEHYVAVMADVDGIAMDPQADKRIYIDGQEESIFKLSIL
jgi:uncharacterized protein (DUF736 family)